MEDLPITGVCIVSDPSKCPPNYTLIDKTYDRPDDADLWKDGIFMRRIMRYLCVERKIPALNEDVLVDVTLINEKDITPPGFTVIDTTHDTREKATKKKCVCVRWMVPSMTKDAITELILLTRAQRKAPVGYTLVGELHNLSLCYKMGRLPQQANAAPPKPNPEVPSYTSTPQAYSMTPLSSGLPYAINPAGSTRPPSAGHNSLTRTGPPEQSVNSLATSNVNPISGIEWKMNPRFKVLIELQNVTIPHIKGKTLAEIERQYEYDFSVERSVAKNSRLAYQQ